ncbi:hypothetical protein [Bdellovibrio reynosensis]|uniref:EF-hand domain-containing protein n=1 Tax=Bdellovibrio reynosensis TaxID=2835041 RepID=A0ABY4CAB3_9BACT|nr:hypothetical protein [Bdellovibrio reynosensis]UOF01714.1 hypothetical protein MNR06_01940 [Bdellovibrio reynosensis]
MSFKKIVSRALACGIALSSVGCSEFLNGKKTEPEVIEFSDTRFKCLQAIPAQLKLYSIGEAQAEEVKQGFNCMSEALRYFNKRTFGSIDGGYTVEEMRRFFGKYFLKQNNVTPEFAAELMKIKRALLGGSTAYITKDEITRLIDILNAVRDEAVTLAPHMKVILLISKKGELPWETISSATEQLRLSLQKLLEKTQIAKSDYSFDDAKRALAGFGEFIRGEEPFAPYERYSNWVGVVEAVKNVLMGQQAQFTGLYQWNDSLNTLISLYEMALKYHYSLSDLKFDNKEKLSQASQFMEQGLHLLGNAHQMKTKGLIPVADIDNLIDQALPRITKQIRTKSIKKTYRAVLMKILDPERKMDSRSVLGLEKKHLASLQREFNIWRLQQEFIDGLGDDKNIFLTQAQLVSAFESFDKNKSVDAAARDDAFEQSALLAAWQDVGELYKSSMTVSFTAEGKLAIAKAAAIRHTWASLTKGNIMRALSRLLLLGYGESRQERMSKVGMNETGLVGWYADFLELGLDAGAFDPRSANSGTRSFLEANFFTFSGDGNALMDQKESFEFVSTLFAAGLASSEGLQSESLAAHCAVAELDVFGKPYLQEECFKQNLKNNFAKYFANLPGMVRYIADLNQARWEEFYRHLAVASAAPNQKVGFVETANIRTMVTILHYIEAVVVIFDKDGNTKLSLEEVYDASPRFTPFFKTIKKITNQTLLEEGFAYLVFKGTIPGAADLTGFQLQKLWGIKDAERMEIVRLFGTLKDELNKPKN